MHTHLGRVLTMLWASWVGGVMSEACGGKCRKSEGSKGNDSKLRILRYFFYLRQIPDISRCVFDLHLFSYEQFYRKEKVILVEILGGGKKIFVIFLVSRTAKNADFCRFLIKAQGSPLVIFFGWKIGPQNFHVWSFPGKICILESENYGFIKDFQIFSRKLGG